MNDQRTEEPESREGIAWFSLIASILLPLFSSFLLFSAALPLGREGGRTMMQVFAFAELGCIVGGVIGFAGSTRSSDFGRVSRLIITVLAGGAGMIWLFGLSGFAGIGP